MSRGNPLDAKKNRQSLVLGIAGLALQFGSFPALVAMKDYLEEDVGMVLLVWFGMIGFGSVFLIAGLGRYAQAKGHEGAWGFVGLFSVFGLLILALLPDRHDQQLQQKRAMALATSLDKSGEQSLLMPEVPEKRPQVTDLAFLFSFLGLLLLPVFFVGALIAVPGVALGHWALVVQNRNPDRPGKWMAIAALVLGYIAVLGGCAMFGWGIHQSFGD